MLEIKILTVRHTQRAPRVQLPKLIHHYNYIYQTTKALKIIYHCMKSILCMQDGNKLGLEN